MENKKSAEELAQEHTAEKLMTFLIAKTFSRHALMNEEEYLKAIGMNDKGLKEEDAVKLAYLNVLTAMTKQFLATKETFKNAMAIMKLYFNEEDKKEQ